MTWIKNKRSTYPNSIEDISTREAILKLKYLTPDTFKIKGIEYYRAVIEYGITDYDDFIKWQQDQPENRIIDWIP